MGFLGLQLTPVFKRECLENSAHKASSPSFLVLERDKSSSCPNMSMAIVSSLLKPSYVIHSFAGSSNVA